MLVRVLMCVHKYLKSIYSAQEVVCNHISQQALHCITGDIQEVSRFEFEETKTTFARGIIIALCTRYST